MVSAHATSSEAKISSPNLLPTNTLPLETGTGFIAPVRGMDRASPDRTFPLVTYATRLPGRPLGNPRFAPDDTEALVS